VIVSRRFLAYSLALVALVAVVVVLIQRDTTVVDRARETSAKDTRAQRSPPEKSVINPSSPEQKSSLTRKTRRVT
jgi:hypothetical protein